MILDLFTGLSVLVGIVTLVWGIVRWFANRERAANEARMKESRETMERERVATDVRIAEAMTKIAALQAELAQAKQDLAVLKERIHSLPNQEALQDKLGSLEEKLEKKIDNLAVSLQASMKAMADAMTTGVVAALRAHESRRP